MIKDLQFMLKIAFLPHWHKTVERLSLSLFSVKLSWEIWNFITYSQEKHHYNELSFIQFHQIALQKKNNINKKQINEKHFLKNFFKKQP